VIHLGGRVPGRRSGKTGAIVLALHLAGLGLAQFAHDHHVALPVALPGCDDPGLHWTNHRDTIDLSAPAEHCPACQVRAAEAVTIGSTPPPAVRAVGPAVVAEKAPTASRIAPLPTVRGPPLA
jgi:hypothetical protein